VLSLLLLLISTTGYPQAPASDLSSCTRLMQQLSALDTKMPVAKSGDWLSEHPEPGQSFGQYVKSDPKKGNGRRTVIYLKPVGSFTAREQEILKANREYLEAFFGLEIKTLEPLPLKSISKKAIRKQKGGIQILTSYINYQVLYPRLPEDAAALMAVTATDLYPNEQWNYVFGEADQVNRIGVSSMARFGSKEKDSSTFLLCLKRLNKTTSHEIAHMLSMDHCIHASCSMNGSNHLEEADSQPLHLCSECSAKLSWRLGYDAGKRLEKILQYARKYSFAEEESYCQKALALIHQ
ncbi:MAG: archaemetzincin, partial [Cytophagaceae bacterium]